MQWAPSGGGAEVILPVRVVYSLWAICNAHLPGEPELPSGLAGSSLPCLFSLSLFLFPYEKMLVNFTVCNFFIVYAIVTGRHSWGQLDAKSGDVAATQYFLVESWSCFESQIFT